MSNSRRITRRAALRSLAVGAGATVLSSDLLARSRFLGVPGLFRQASSAPAPHIKNFGLRAVHLLGGPFLDAQERDRKYLLSIDPDRLLLMFRVTSGVRTRVKPLGGWEGPSCELRGHTIGHYLSACSLMYASTGDVAFKAKCDAIVRGLADCQAAMTDQGYHAGYLSAFPESFFDRVEAHKRVWAPWYTMHKIMSGLLNAHIHTGNSQALDVLTRLAGWVKFRVDRLTRDQMQAMLAQEDGGMSEVLARLYVVTGNSEHLRLAEAFNRQALVEPLARGEDKLDGMHVNTQIPRITGLALEYEITGKEEYRNAARFFWERVVQHRSFANGGSSDEEEFFPEEETAKHLSAVTAETCNTHNMLKLTQRIFAWEPRASVMDFYERALYNHILASQDPRTGMFAYYTPMQPGQFRMYSTPEDSFWCCVGTGMENPGRFGEAIYARSDDSLYVNLFIASELNWKERDFRLHQETQFPDVGSTRLVMKVKQPVRLALKIRQPGWCAGQLSLKVNGKQEVSKTDTSGYVTLTREWRDEDVVEIQLPMTLRTEALPGASNVVALFYGPILLAGRLGTDGMPEEGAYAVPEIGNGAQQEKYAKWPAPPVPALPYAAADVTSHLQLVADKPLTYNLPVSGRKDGLTLIPFFRLHQERYTIYWTTT